MTIYVPKRPINERDATKKILALYEQYKRSGGDKTYAEEIQKVVDRMGKTFLLYIEEPKQMRIEFTPRTRRGVVDLGKLGKPKAEPGVITLPKIK